MSYGSLSVAVLLSLLRKCYKFQGSECSRQILDSGKKNNHAKNVKIYIRSCFITVTCNKEIFPTQLLCDTYIVIIFCV
jgi:hypothetical protein